jgi:hypothetical protein
MGSQTKPGIRFMEYDRQTIILSKFKTKRLLFPGKRIKNQVFRVITSNTPFAAGGLRAKVAVITVFIVFFGTPHRTYRAP